MKTAERVIFNTAILYVRLIIVMAIGLFTTRLVLDALGEVNYGIYVLVAGVVGMLAILQSAMATTSMRYMSHSLGTGNKKIIANTFNTTLFLHIVIGFIVLFFIEVGGYFMFEYFLQIPEDKIFDAKVVYQFMALTTFVTIIAVPYDAVINSHENLLLLSVVDILGSLLKLALAIYLSLTNLNLLIIYGLGLFVIQFILRLLKRQYSVKKYEECKINFKKHMDKAKLKEILSFTWWNLFGSIAAVSVTQVRSVLLNMFFGVKVNAAEGISKSASSQVNTVSVNLTRAINPQLVKSEGAGNRDRMLEITSISTKFSILLFSLIAIPVIVETQYLLDLWLKDVPEFAVIFTQLTLIGLLISKFTFEITNAIRAVGRIKEFQVIETIILVLNIPIVYILFKQGYSPEYIYYVSIVFSIIISVYRLYIGKKIADLNIKSFLGATLLPSIIPIIIAFALTILINSHLSQSFYRLILITLTSILVLTLYFYFFAISAYEKSVIISVFHKVKTKFTAWRIKK
ncbi:MAG: MATE family efflux transporter [Bacteroidales bacterium]|nr:MATE family efflux transporter [Bacteroidales bacterium]